MKTKISLLVMLSLGLAYETPAQPADGLRDGLPTTIRVTHGPMLGRPAADGGGGPRSTRQRPSGQVSAPVRWGTHHQGLRGRPLPSARAALRAEIFLKSLTRGKVYRASKSSGLAG